MTPATAPPMIATSVQSDKGCASACVGENVGYSVGEPTVGVVVELDVGAVLFDTGGGGV
eukprot:CAMPEP_0168521644 /NCGR_PEP_ID=MMETSP0405-20121227/8794_1 /TAXON_ID=498012 /ORGANISM="Trichosphaerium sp, Strain Am-I-7 wt" /LENGTH=58 /DNA_ID=CAMNT_0008542933 /DNA_START=58 /DNA_END=231 /DNA_ORIENTATION=-